MSGGVPANILVIRLSSLGDVILTLPVLDSIRRADPAVRVTYLVKGKYAPLVDGHPAVSEVIRFEDHGVLGLARLLRRKQFDAVLDLHDTGRSALWRFVSGARVKARYQKNALARRRLVWFGGPFSAPVKSVPDRYLDCLAGLGVPAAVRRPDLRHMVPEGGASEWRAKTGPGPWLGIAPGALHATKRWPAERFAEAADRLLEDWAGGGESGTAVLLGDVHDQPVIDRVLGHLGARAVSAAGRTGLPALSALLSECKMLLTNDSGLLHAANALGVPAVAVFGPTVREFGFMPAWPDCVVLENTGLDCRPCSLHGGTRCPKRHFKCMEDISVDSVVAAARRVAP